MSDMRMPSGPLTEEQCIDLYYELLSAANARRTATIDGAMREFEREAKGARNDYTARIQALRRDTPISSVGNTNVTVSTPVAQVRKWNERQKP